MLKYDQPGFETPSFRINIPCVHWTHFLLKVTTIASISCDSSPSHFPIYIPFQAASRGVQDNLSGSLKGTAKAPSRPITPRSRPQSVHQHPTMMRYDASGHPTLQRAQSSCGAPSRSAMGGSGVGEWGHGASRGSVSLPASPRRSLAQSESSKCSLLTL